MPEETLEVNYENFEILPQKINAEGDKIFVINDIKNFLVKRNVGKEPENGPLLMVLSGTQRGVYSGGGVTALEELGMTNAFKTAVGVSAGSCGIGYFLAGQAHVGTTFFYEDNIGKNFINFPRGMKEGESVVDIDWVCEQFRNGDKKLNVEKFKQNPTVAYFAATNAETGEGVLLEAQRMLDPVCAVHASIAIPEAYIKKVFVNVDGIKKQYVDGSVALPFPVKEILEKVTPTSILVFANRPKSFQDSFFAKFARSYFSKIVSPALSLDIENWVENFDSELEFLKKSNIPYLIVWTDDKVGSLEKDQIKLKKAAEDFKQFILDLFK